MCDNSTDVLSNVVNCTEYLHLVQQMLQLRGVLLGHLYCYGGHQSMLSPNTINTQQHLYIQVYNRKKVAKGRQVIPALTGRRL